MPDEHIGGEGGDHRKGRRGPQADGRAGPDVGTRADHRDLRATELVDAVEQEILPGVGLNDPDPLQHFVDKLDALV